MSKSKYPDSFSYNFIFGESYFANPPDRASIDRIVKEVEDYGDITFVNARESIPNPGKASEKSGAWWKQALEIEDAKFHCKADDDSIIHPWRIVETFEQIQKM